MKQPEIGIRIAEARNQRGITQKELSESCHIDIRTIQRIEAGEVTPRISTLRLIEKTLSIEIKMFDEDRQENENSLSPHLLLFLLVTGVLYLMSAILLSPILPGGFLSTLYLLKVWLYITAGVLFYYGFYKIGKYRNISILSISSVAFMVLIPLLLFTAITLAEFGFSKHINQLIIILMGVNGILFGTGFLLVNDQHLYKISGIILITGAPFIIIPVPVINYIGWWLSLLSILLQVIIVYLEYRNSRQYNMSVVV